MSVNRRQFIKAGSLALGSLAVHSLPLQARPAEEKATVYFTPEITTESLLRIYEKVCAPLQGRIAIKLHTGEPHGPNILPRDMVRALQARIPKSSIVECNVLYPSPRQTTARPCGPTAGPSARWTSWMPTAKSPCPSPADDTLRKWPWARTCSTMIPCWC